MAKKQKIIIIVISFLLLIVPFVTSAGCFGDKPIIDEIHFGCIRVSIGICETSILLENNCNESFYYYDAKNCSSLKNTNQTPYFKRIISKVDSFLHEDFIEIPPNWRLAYYNEKGPRSICGSSEKGYGDCVDIHCDKDSIISGKNSIDFGIDSSRQYTIRGHYGEKNLSTKNTNPNPPFVILIISIFLFFFFTAVLIVQRQKRKNLS